MGLSAPPQRGFTDFQRTGPWDSGILWQDNTLLSGATITTGTLDVSRWAYVAGLDSLGAGSAYATYSWYADSAASNLVGQMIIPLTANCGAAQLRLPNLGPFLKISWTAPLAQQFSHQSVLFGTNRFHPLSFIPIRGMLVNSQGQAVGANSSIQVYPVSYYAGPILIQVDPTFASAEVVLQVMLTDASWVTGDILFPAANASSDYRTIAPFGAWRLNVLNNSAAAGTFGLVCLCPFTGST